MHFRLHTNVLTYFTFQQCHQSRIKTITRKARELSAKAVPTPTAFPRC